MAPALKSTLLAMATAALGMSTMGCSSSPEEAPAAQSTSGGEAKGGEGSCSGEGSCKGGEASCSGQSHEESKGGEGSCGEGSCS